MNKWSNVRDAYLRSIKTKSGQGACKPYVYAQHLEFLLKISESAETASNYNHDTVEISEDSLSDICPRPKINRKKKELDPIEREILAHINKPTTQETIRSDSETILLSFSMYMRDMTEEELLEFQMETLKTIKNIKRRRVSATSSPSPVHTSTSNDPLSSRMTQYAWPSTSSSSKPVQTITSLQNSSKDMTKRIQHPVPPRSQSLREIRRKKTHIQMTQSNHGQPQSAPVDHSEIDEYDSAQHVENNSDLE